MSDQEPTTEDGRRLIEAIAAGDSDGVSIALVKATFAEPSSAWLYDRCLDLAATGPWEVTAVAATCIGHLARLRGYARADTVAFLESLVASHPRVRPYAEDALEDVHHGAKLSGR